MKTKLLFLSLLLGFLSCSKNSDYLEPIKSQKSERQVSTKMNRNQVQKYVDFFLSLQENSKNNDAFSIGVGKTLDNIDYYIKDSDTLLYSFNYKNNNGFLLVANSIGFMPIIAYSNQGNLNFNTLDNNPTLEYFVESSANKVLNVIKNPTEENLSYFEKWKDLGNEDYEYELDLYDDEPKSDNTPIALGLRRDYSNGKESVYPYTGKELNSWKQEGKYSKYAKNGALIGCPAVAISMLLYDTSNRMIGNRQITIPEFSYQNKDESFIDDTAKKFRQVADSIPNYSWGTKAGSESGAEPKDIEVGLRKLGYTQATLEDFNFEKFYNNLTYEDYIYGNFKGQVARGVLLGAYSKYGGGGHIWFCDGYFEQSYKVRKKFLGFVVKSWTEYEDKYYMNWGWGGETNGWYSLDINNYWEGENSKIPLVNELKMFTNLRYYENEEY